MVGAVDPVSRAHVSVTEGAWLPLVPVPFLDESFGSWLRRCAEGYVTSEYQFASAVLALDHKAPQPNICDWDTEPPTELLDSLARHTPYYRSELEYLVAPRGPSLLPQSMRDGYCPECFAEDQPRGIYYTRRAWLDAWSIWCPMHHCLLGEFKREEYQVRPSVKDHGIDTIFGDANEHAAQPLRVNQSVAPVLIPPTDLTDQPIEWLERISLTDWFDPAMLQSVVGRDLMIYMGSAAAAGLFAKLFGHGRFWGDLWHDANRNPRWWPELIHPMGPIRMRVEAAYFANLVWRCLHQTGKAASGQEGSALDRLTPILRDEFERRGMRPMMNRWPHADRELWKRAFGA